MRCAVCGAANRPRRARVHGERPGFTCVHCRTANFEDADGSWTHLPYRPVGERWPAGKRRKACVERRDDEHAVAEGATLCGIPEAAVTVYRHLWTPTGAASCAGCARSAGEVDRRWPADRR
ncbi:hypothetical protein AB0I28_21560 [Phytomonospora sp. NPDC050363]|uniref:hypothetical protein n=1 Tax=Phytomonospora sp. NPDC050363 TaxID=3155642 RepID=UPI0033FBDA0E